jgi:hypothetical protein
MNYLLCIGLIICCTGTALSQENLFRNPSFEDGAQEILNLPPWQRTPPNNWIGLLPGSTPDQQPGNFGVMKSAFKGSYFAGMVSRPPDGPSSGWETLSQDLGISIQKNKSYTVLMHLAYDPGFKVTWDDNLYLFQDPIPLTFYLYRREVIDPSWPPTYRYFKKFLGRTSKPIDHDDWTFYSLKFETDEDGFNFFAFSAEPPDLKPIGSNIMIDEVYLNVSEKADSVAKIWAKEDSIRKCEVTLPNLLIRSHSNANQFFIPSCPSLIQSYNLEVFNRWGKLVYKTEGNKNWWNGTDQKGEPLVDGIYFYHFKSDFVKSNTGKTSPPISGWVKLISDQ